MKSSSGNNFKKTVYQYGNYREYLNDFYSTQKEKNKKFTFRFFAKLAGFNSYSFFKMVLQGQRNLALDSIEKIAGALKLNKEELFFFKNLVLLNQATSIEERQTYADQLMKSREYRKSHPLSEAQYHYFSHWYYVPIRELVALDGFKENYAWIAESITPKITANQAEKAIDELLLLGLLKRNEAGSLVQSEEDVATPDEVVSAYLAQFHTEMIKKASESIQRFPRERREISSITFVITDEEIKKIKEIIYKCRKEIVDVTTRRPRSNKVYQLNFQLFPLAEFSHEAKKDE